MPSTVYKGDLAEVSFAPETGLRIRIGTDANSDVGLTVGTAAGNITELTFKAEVNDTLFQEDNHANTADRHALRYPVNGLVGSQLIWTTSGGSGADDIVSGDLASNGNDILIAANDRAVFGTDKLRVKHTDSNADIENTTGNIVIKNDSSSTSEQIILQAKGGEDSIKAVADGAVELYHNNSKKLETVSGGVTVTGTLTATAFSGITTAATSDFVQVSRYTVPGEVSEVEIDFDNTNYTHFRIFVTSQNNAYDANVYVRFKVGGSYQTGNNYYTGTVKKHQGGFDTSTYGGANQSYGYLIDNVGGDNSTYERWAIIGDINTGTSDGPGFMRYDSYHKGSSNDYANTMGIVAYQNFGTLQGIRFYNSSGNLEGGAIYTLYGLK